MRLTTTPPPTSWALAAVAALLVLAFAGSAQAQIDGIPGPTFALAARGGEITSGTLDSIYSWGYASGQGPLQYPGPTLIVTQGDDVTVALTNELPNSQSGSPPPNVSIVFPGQAVTATGGIEGLLTREAPPGGSVSYSFTAGAPGTYLYHSGTRPELQIEMGLVGALIVRPIGYTAGNPTGYGGAGSEYDREALLLLSEMDPRIHSTVEMLGTAGLEGNNDLSNPSPAYWFINGRSFGDTLADSFVPWLPTQPYGSLMRVRPGQRLLVRVIGGGRLDHPLHFQGNRVEVIARDGRLLSSGPGAGADLATSVSTLTSQPGETVDAILQWTGEGLGWDIYGPIDPDPVDPDMTCTDADNDMKDDAAPDTVCHDAVCVDADSDGFDDVNWEYCPDHGAFFPVLLPSDLATVIGGFYSGSPYLGRFGDLPPGTGGLNPDAGYPFAVGSQNTNELVDNGLPGFGMMTFLIVEPPFVPLPGE